MAIAHLVVADSVRVCCLLRKWSDSSAKFWARTDFFFFSFSPPYTSVDRCCIIFSIFSSLVRQGSLPVGEIGKLLQEATANSSLSQTLKDQFGGLKKFLEKVRDPPIPSCARRPLVPVFVYSLLTARHVVCVIGRQISDHELLLMDVGFASS